MLRFLYCVSSVIALFTSSLSAQMPQIVAHRGASFDAPENTLPAFELAWQQNADAIEGDFYLTKDKHIVCIHDKSTRRYCDQDLQIADSTLAELRKLDVGSYRGERFRGTRIPTFHEVAKTVPLGKKIYIEIKCGPEIVPFLIRQIDETNLNPNQIVVISFNREVIEQLNQSRSTYKTYWLSSLKIRNGKATPTPSQVKKTLQQINAHGFSSSFQQVTAPFVREVKKSGFEYHVWTVNAVADAARLAALGVHSITTDRPGLIRRALEPIEKNK